MPIRHSIVIGAMNHLEDATRPCLESIRKQTDLAECQVIVVSNGSTDGTDQYVRSLGSPFDLVSFAEPLGFARAYNEGIRCALGEYIILLNNDTMLLDQPRGEWLRMLTQPFADDEQVGLTGPFMTRSEPAGADFLIFFCVCIHRRVFEQIHYLDEIFGAGCGEDTDFCLRAVRAGYKQVQVPTGTRLVVDHSAGHPIGVGGFPIYHKGHVSLDDVKGHGAIFKRNSDILAERWNSQVAFGNCYERAVFLPHDDIKNDLHRREITRYSYAAKHLTGKRVLDLGCSVGYAKRLLPPDLDYLGIDYDPRCIDAANRYYADDHYRYEVGDIAALDWARLGRFDTIIAYEVLEHLERGREIAQQLKEHCDTLLCTTPYNEPPGMLGPHHKLHNLREHDFPGFAYAFIQEDGEIHRTPDHDRGLNLLLFSWHRGQEYLPQPKVLCSISTRDRYPMLAQCLQSVGLQSVKPHKVLIFDDGEHRDLRTDPIFDPTFRMLHSQGIEWEVIFSHGAGQHLNHQHANTRGYDLVWRIDDDEVAEPDVLAKLLAQMRPDVGAVGGAVFEPRRAQAGGTGLLEDIYVGPNIQWAPAERIAEVEHLHSSFLYRAGLVPYPLDLSPVAHREETIFSHALLRKGYRLLVDLSARTFHYKQATGGIRSHQSSFYYQHDERIFAEHMARWGYRLVTLGVGLGDCLAFLNILPALQARYPKRLIIGTAYPEVFDGQDVKLIPVAQAQLACGDNIYNWMQTHDWRRSIVEAFAAMYGVGEPAEAVA